MRKWHDVYFECTMRFEMYFIWRKKIIMKNSAYIQWDDLSFIMRPGWQDKYCISEMECLAKQLKEKK
jgi:hypothetical protein